MKFPPLSYCRPQTLAGALQRLDALGGDAQLLAGGQSLLPMLAMRLAAPALLIDLNGIADLDAIDNTDERLRIGAMTRYAALESDASVALHAPLLTAALPYVAHVAIRQRGTIGGSLALADPAAELPACVLAMQGHIELTSTTGCRTVAADEYFLGLYETARRDDEIVTGIHLPLTGARGFGFHEVSRRHGDYALAGAAVVADVDTEGRLFDLRIAMFGIDDRPRLARAAAGVLEGRALTQQRLQEADRALASDFAPLDGILGNTRTRLAQAGAALRRAVASLQLAGPALPKVAVTKSTAKYSPTSRSTTTSQKPVSQDSARLPSRSQDTATQDPVISAAESALPAGWDTDPFSAHDDAPAAATVALTVNGEQVTAPVPVRRHLADFLRQDLQLTGTHVGCEHGVCGACTVRVNGVPVRACLMLAVQAHGMDVVTIEGLHASGEIADLQEAFLTHNAAQCGFCTPGMLQAAATLLHAPRAMTRAAIRVHLSGNYCRCTGYQAIVDAVESCLRGRLARAAAADDPT